MKQDDISEEQHQSSLLNFTKTSTSCVSRLALWGCALGPLSTGQQPAPQVR